MEVSGTRSSWLTIPRSSARNRSNSSSGVMSCSVTTTDSTSPSSERMGVAFTNVVNDRPSGNLQDDLLGADGLAGAQRLRKGELGQRNLAPIGTPEGDHIEELLYGGIPASVGPPQSFWPPG